MNSLKKYEKNKKKIYLKKFSNILHNVLKQKAVVVLPNVIRYFGKLLNIKN